MGLYLGHLLLAGFCVSALHAGEIEGSIIIKRKLTKRKVTPTAGAYQRGVAVDLAAEPVDPLSYERQHVVIYLEGNLPSHPVTAIMEQKNRQFLPDILVVPSGSSISFPNSDPIFHNVFSLSKPKSFDLGNYPQQHTRTVVFQKAGLVFVHCHLHPNMGATIVVTPNHWFTKGDGSGHFTLSGIPEGEYTLVAWHKAAGFFRKSIKVGNTRTARIEFIIPLKEEQVIPVASR